MKAGILSDTHGLLRQEVLRELQGCDVILHGGDINRQDILDRLRQIAPVHVVRGNNDKEWAQYLPLFLDFSLNGYRVYMTHKKKDLPKDLAGYDLVICGHTHRYEEKREGSTYMLNPGSCGPRRFNQDITMAVVELGERKTGISIRRIDIPHEKRPAVGRDIIQRADIEGVVREIRKGRSAAEISKKLEMDPEVTEQICRLYLTHPGADADGIMTKMGL